MPFRKAATKKAFREANPPVEWKSSFTVPAPHAYYIAHVRDTDNGEVTLGTWPFGTQLREFILGPNETILVRDETASDVLVIASHD